MFEFFPEDGGWFVVHSVTELRQFVSAANRLGLDYRIEAK